jgi:hypothetical protein
MADSVLKQLKSRFKTEWLNNENLVRFYTNFERVEALAEKLKSKKDQLAKSNTLTDVGKVESIRDFAAKEVVPALHRERVDLEGWLTRIADQRQKLAQPEINKMDTVAAMQRQEIRSFLRGLSASERLGLLMGNPDMQTLAAVLEMPAAMSGLTEDMRQKIQDIQVEKKHPQVIELHTNAKDCIGLADSAIRMTLNEIRRDGGSKETTARSTPGWRPCRARPTNQPQRRRHRLRTSPLRSRHTNLEI